MMHFEPKITMLVTYEEKNILIFVLTVQNPAIKKDLHIKR